MGAQAKQVQTKHGLMIIPVNDIYVGAALESFGEYSPQEVALLSGLVPKGGVVVEAGANLGAMTLPLAAAAGPNGRVYAFEPERTVFHMLCGSLALNAVTNVEAWPVGLGSEIGQMALTPASEGKSGTNWGAGELRHDAAGDQIPVTTVDNLGLARCDLIKADVQGMEEAVLTGAADTIARFRPTLYVENDIRDRSPSLISKLGSLGYDCFWHLPAVFARTEPGQTRIVSINLLGLPSGRKVQSKDLRQVADAQDWPMPTDRN